MQQVTTIATHPKNKRVWLLSHPSRLTCWADTHTCTAHFLGRPSSIHLSFGYFPFLHVQDHLIEAWSSRLTTQEPKPGSIKLVHPTSSKCGALQHNQRARYRVFRPSLHCSLISHIVYRPLTFDCLPPMIIIHSRYKCCKKMYVGIIAELKLMVLVSFYLRSNSMGVSSAVKTRKENCRHALSSLLPTSLCLSPCACALVEHTSCHTMISPCSGSYRVK